MELYIGLMSGTSADGIDAVLVNFNSQSPVLIASQYSPYSTDLRERILALCQDGEREIDRMGELDRMLGQAFAKAVIDLLDQQAISAQEIRAIGSHGQTIRHRPNATHPFTMQIGDPNIIAAMTGITTVTDFRRKDMAHGGQGAPLVPAFHQYVFSAQHHSRVIVNIGGIANVTILQKGISDSLIGFDTGPGNVLLDGWINQHQQKRHDDEGSWAASGKVEPDFLQQLLSDPYFQLPPPKSTGREYFNASWLNAQLGQYGKAITETDVQTTLAELSAHSITNAIKSHTKGGEILVCGGGVKNKFLMRRLSEIAAPHFDVNSTEQYGIDADWVEAIAFAWLARQTLNRLPGNHPGATGAKQAAILGGVYCS